MKAPGENCSDVTNLKPCDHQALFEVLASLARPTEPVLAAFRRRNDFPCGLPESEKAEDS